MNISETNLGTSPEPEPLMPTDSMQTDLSFRGWYARTVGKWWIISQVAAWLFFGAAIPIAYGGWRWFVWADEWAKTHGHQAAARFDATHTWVKPSFTKRGRFRKGHWRRK